MVSVDIDKLVADNLIESIYVSPPLGDKYPESLEHPETMWKSDEFYEKLASIKDIDFSPVDWSICNDAAGRRFAYVRYYLLVLRPEHAMQVEEQVDILLNSAWGKKRGAKKPHFEKISLL